MTKNDNNNTTPGRNLPNFVKIEALKSPSTKGYQITVIYNDNNRKEIDLNPSSIYCYSPKNSEDITVRIGDYIDVNDPALTIYTKRNDKLTAKCRGIKPN